MNTVTFRTATQAAIFQCELKGQISDGHWENTSHTGWQEWTGAEVLVGPVPGRNFHATKDNFNFAAKDLLDVVGDRMIAYARMALAGVHLTDIRRLVDGVTELLSGETRDDPFRLMYAGMPKTPGAHWDMERVWLRRWDMEWVREILAGVVIYDAKSLRADLREMKLAARQKINVL